MLRYEHGLVLLALVVSSPAWATAKEEEVYAAFETFCLTHINQSAEIPKMFARVGVKPLPAERAEAFLAPQKGTAWMMKGKETNLIITLTDAGVCTTSAPYASGKATTELFEKLLRHKKLATEDMGGQQQTIYAVTFPSSAKIGGPTSHALVLVTTSKLSSIDGVIINVMAEKMVAESGVTVPKWPE